MSDLEEGEITDSDKEETLSKVSGVLARVSFIAGQIRGRGLLGFFRLDLLMK